MSGSQLPKPEKVPGNLARTAGTTNVPQSEMRGELFNGARNGEDAGPGGHISQIYGMQSPRVVISKSAPNLRTEETSSPTPAPRASKSLPNLTAQKKSSGSPRHSL